jgi:hypothetical protein
VISATFSFVVFAAAAAAAAASGITIGNFELQVLNGLLVGGSLLCRQFESLRHTASAVDRPVQVYQLVEIALPGKILFS